MTDKPTVGFIGLGIMGKHMARHVLQAGYPLVVHNRSRPAVAELVGGRGAPPPPPPRGGSPTRRGGAASGGRRTCRGDQPGTLKRGAFKKITT
jgi:hypothetical protein